MVGLGTLINTGSVIVCSLAGLLLKKGIKEETGEALMKVCGVSSMFIGISGTVANMLVFQEGKLQTQGTMLMVASLVIGTLIGELLHLEQAIDGLGERLKKAAKRDGDNKFIDGFVNSSLIICVGAMAVVGSIRDGTTGDWSMLAVKAVLDGVICLILSSSLGVGVAFSAIPLFVLQGGITLVAALGGSFVSDTMVSGMDFIGSVLVFCVGINIAFGKHFRVGNMVPAILVPVVYSAVSSCFGS